MSKFNATAIRQHQASRLLTKHYRNTRENIKGDGVKLCRRAKSHNSPNPDIAQIEVKLRDGRTIANMHDVAHCGNAHLCAYCAGAKAAHNRDWITEVFTPALRAHGLVTGLFTLTAHHRRDSDWSVFVASFYKAVTTFGRRFDKEMKRIGSPGRFRAMECPVGSNGLHLHLHDLIAYPAGADVSQFAAKALAIWKAALREQGLRCTSRGVDFRPHGTFDPLYVAKNAAFEVAAHDTKTTSKSDLKTLFELLDKSARGDAQAGQDWVRAAKAIQGRDRWNVGMLANKLGIPCPSDWKKVRAGDASEVAGLIEYPQAQHMMATSNDSDRPGLALILHAARNDRKDTGRTQKMVEALCIDYTHQKLIAAPWEAAAALARAVKHTQTLVDDGAIDASEVTERNALAAAECKTQQQEREAAIQSKLAAALAPAPEAWMLPHAELDFS